MSEREIFNKLDESKRQARQRKLQEEKEQKEQEALSKLETSFGADWIVESRFDAQVGARITIEHQPPEVQIKDITEALGDMEGVQVEDSPDDNTFYVKLTGMAGQIQTKIASMTTTR